MKKFVLSLGVILSVNAWGAPLTIGSPDGKLKVMTDVVSGEPVYSVTYNGNTILENSPLGLRTDIGDFSTGMSLVGSKTAMREQRVDVR